MRAVPESKEWINIVNDAFWNNQPQYKDKAGFGY